MTNIQKTPLQTPQKKPMSKEQIGREFLRRAKFASFEPKELLVQLADVVERHWAGEKGKKLNKELNKKLNAALPIVSLDLHYELANTVGERIRPLVIEFARQLIVEYDCKTPTEKALAEVVVSAYARILECSKSMQDITLVKYTSNALNGLYEIISKELDRANRHFVTSLTTLRQIKSPNVEIKVRAQTAIIAQNQQFNTTQAVESPKADYEINKPT
jgi:hypothetical protein